MSYYLDYIVETYRSIFEINDSCRMGYEESDTIRFPNLSSDFFDGKNAKPNQFVWKTWSDRKIPVLFSKDDSMPFYTMHKEHIEFHYDLIGAAFYFLSGWQEIHDDERDSRGRYPFQNSFQFEHNSVAIPVVNYYFDIITKAIEELEGKPKFKLWDDEMAVAVSHDIDRTQSGWKEGGFSELKKGNVFTALKIFGSKLGGRDPWDNLDDVIECEKELGITSTFYVLAKQGGEDADYSLNHVRPSFREMDEIGVHGSLGTDKAPIRLRGEKESIQEGIIGHRFHFLKLEPKELVRTLESAEIKYDTSLGFAESIGFRYGFCLPFFLFDHEKKKASSILELPLIVMDASLRQDAYMGTDSKKFELLYEVVDEVKKFNGLLTILWHNHYFSKYKYEGWKERFIELIEYCKGSKAKFFTGQQVYSYFKNE